MEVELKQAPGPDDILAGGGEMGALMRSVDWSRTRLGPVEGWSQRLCTVAKILLANRFPMLLLWGPELCQLYNDAYRPVLGSKHPRSMGQPARECWAEIWDIIGPLLLTPYNGGPATWDDDIFLELNRSSFVEETHFTIAYSPVPDEEAPGGIGGVLATVHEITQQVVQARRVAALRDLGARSSEAKTAEGACQVAAEAFGRHPKDVPFALLYLIDPDQKTARLAAAAGTLMGSPASPVAVDLTSAGGNAATWPLGLALRTEAPQVVEGLGERFALVPPGPWSDPPNRAIVLPVPSNIQHQLAGFLVLGISARLELDNFYHSFCELATAQVATAITNARTYEQERRRAEALAELDRAKTAFFSNVSHEFRTPLTLMLGPLEEVLATPEGGVLPETRSLIEVAHRNSLRLLKLVNSLLDFSRIEAGRVRASYQLVDLAALTADLASSFRSTIESAGLRLILDCPPLPAPVCVDRDMWEKIILNLISNAFKFTFEGEIGVEVSPTADGRWAQVRVRDTGTGVPAEELPRLFERFHRVEGARGRTFEGTGIGLALVQELVRLHGGTVSVTSELGRGTLFTVCIPFGTEHLPLERIDAAPAPASTATSAEIYVDEAALWLPDERGQGTGRPGSPPERSNENRTDRRRVLLADDNADMREYVRRLLQARYVVEAVPDGEAALVAARTQPPDLVLSDVMMPGLDGVGLVAALRADPRTREVPIVLLSARAGEEATIEGLHGGADDYLVKPFSARELFARVETHINLAHARAETIERERDARDQAEQLALEQRSLRDALEQQIIVDVQLNAALREVGEEALARTRQAELRAQVGAALTSSAPLQVQLQDCAEAIVRHLDVAFARIWTLSDAEQILELRASAGMYTHLDGGHSRVPVGALKIGLIAAERRPHLTNDVLHDPRVSDSEWARETGMAAFAGYPLIVGDHLVGVLAMFARSALSQDTLDALGPVASTIALSIERHRAEDERRRIEHQREAFLASAAHDLKTPLTGIQGSVQLLRRLMARPDFQPERVAEILPIIEASTKKAAGLIDELLDVSRLGTTGMLGLNRSAVDLVQLAGRVVAEQQLATRQHRLQLTAGTPSLSGIWDAARLDRAISNLIGNAIKYSPAGGDIRVQLQEETLAGRRWAVLSVQDQGVGIPSGELERIFDRFHRGENVTGQIPGSGIGLAYVREIAHRHGGSVTAASEEGRGSTFMLRLPLD